MKIYKCFPQGKFKVLTMSYDDGNKADVRLVSIFNKYGIRGTFNLNYGLLRSGFTWQHECGMTVRRIPEEEINQRVKEAEQYAEADKKRKEEVETTNRADSLIYELEKQLRENGDKLSSEDKDSVQREIDEFKKVREGGDTEAIKNAMDVMTQKVYAVFGKLYQQEQAAQGAEGGFQGAQENDDGTIDADAEIH